MEREEERRIRTLTIDAVRGRARAGWEYSPCTSSHTLALFTSDCGTAQVRERAEMAGSSARARFKNVRHCMWRAFPQPSRLRQCLSLRPANEKGVTAVRASNKLHKGQGGHDPKLTGGGGRVSLQRKHSFLCLSSCTHSVNNVMPS